MKRSELKRGERAATLALSITERIVDTFGQFSDFPDFTAKEYWKFEEWLYKEILKSLSDAYAKGVEEGEAKEVKNKWVQLRAKKAHNFWTN